MLVFPSSRGGVAATTSKRPPSEAGADGVVKTISDRPVRAFLTFDGASTPPLEEGNRSNPTIYSLSEIVPIPFRLSPANSGEHPTSGGHHEQTFQRRHQA